MASNVSEHCHFQCNTDLASPPTSTFCFVSPGRTAKTKNAIVRLSPSTNSSKSLSQTTPTEIYKWRHQIVSSCSNHANLLQKVYGLAVGSGPPGNVETELLRIADWTWSSGAKYPFTRSDISSYAAVMHEENFYIFGGWSEKAWTTFSTIAKYNPDTDTWTKVGELNMTRSRSRVIISQGAFLVIGDFRATDKCQLTGSSMICVEQEPVVPRYG